MRIQRPLVVRVGEWHSATTERQHRVHISQPASPATRTSTAGPDFASMTVTNMLGGSRYASVATRKSSSPTPAIAARLPIYRGTSGSRRENKVWLSSGLGRTKHPLRHRGRVCATWKADGSIWVRPETGLERGAWAACGRRVGDGCGLI